MVKPQIYRGGVPYDEALARLDIVFPCKPGDLYTHDQLLEVIQAERGSQRYRGVIAAWIRRQLRRGKKLSGRGRARGIGIMVCTIAEDIRLSTDEVHQGTRKHVRVARHLADVETGGMGADQLAQFNNLRLMATRLAAEGRAELKKLAPPPSVVPNVRRLRG